VDQFSRHDEDSVFSRMSRVLEATNSKVEASLTLDDENSPLYRLRRELLQDKAERIRDDLDKQVGVLREPGATDYGLFTPDHDRTLSGIHKRLLRRRHR